MGLAVLQWNLSFLTRDWTHSPCSECGFLTTRPPGKSLFLAFLNSALYFYYLFTLLFVLWPIVLCDGLVIRYVLPIIFLEETQVPPPPCYCSWCCSQYSHAYFFLLTCKSFRGTDHQGQNFWVLWYTDFPSGSVGKKSTCQCKRHGFELWTGKIP